MYNAYSKCWQYSWIEASLEVNVGWVPAITNNNNAGMTHDDDTMQ